MHNWGVYISLTFLCSGVSSYTHSDDKSIRKQSVTIFTHILYHRNKAKKYIIW